MSLRSRANKINRFIFEKKLKIEYKRKHENKDFTIVSSNCTGGKIYEILDIEYNTPFIGLFIMEPCFIKLALDFDKKISNNLRFVKNSKYHNLIKNIYPTGYPIALLDDIEIHFLHYESESEAQEKWERRLRRINFENLNFILTDQKLFAPSLLSPFDKVAQKKILLTSRTLNNPKSSIRIEPYGKVASISNLYKNLHLTKGRINLIDWLTK